MDLFLCIAVGCETIENGNCHRQALVAYAPIIVSAFWFLVFTYLHHCILSHVPLSISMRSCSSLGSKRTLSMPFCGGCVVCLVLDVVSCLFSSPCTIFSLSRSRSLLSSHGTIRVVLPYPPLHSPFPPYLTHPGYPPTRTSDTATCTLDPRHLAFPRIPPHSPLPPARHLASASVFHASTPASRSFYAICVAALFVYYHISLLGSVSVGSGRRGVWTRTLILYSL